MLRNKGLGRKLLALLAIVLLIAWPIMGPLYATAKRSATHATAIANPNLQYQFENLAQRYPRSFAAYFGRPTAEMAEAAVRLGRQVFISEGCAHCHGPATDLSGATGLPAPSIGPDLNQVGGRYSNDWHAIHLFEPEWTVAGSPMPSYPWLFDGAPDQPNRRGLALITYLQWLGSWLETYSYYEKYQTIEALQEAAEEEGLGKAVN